MKKVPYIHKTCAYCGKAFEVRPSLDRVKFCSRDCYWKNMTFSREPNFTCAYCGKTTWKQPCFAYGSRAVKKQKYCSDACWHKASSEQRRGENNPAWKGGLTLVYKYIHNSRATKEWARQVMERASYKCEECGSEAEHAHHIRSVEELITLLYSLDNGKALCTECHAKQPNHNGNFIRRPQLKEKLTVS